MDIIREMFHPMEAGGFGIKIPKGWNDFSWKEEIINKSRRDDMIYCFWR
jgi:hypothetical protein